MYNIANNNNILTTTVAQANVWVSDSIIQYDTKKKDVKSCDFTPLQTHTHTHICKHII